MLSYRDVLSKERDDRLGNHCREVPGKYVDQDESTERMRSSAKHGIKRVSYQMEKARVWSRRWQGIRAIVKRQ